MSKLWIGTSGWHYQHWRGNFYPERFPASEMLDTYAEKFRTVEVNNSFYRLPEISTVHNWVKQTPRRFCFAVKASRYITHNRKLLDPENSFAKFFSVAKEFGNKLGPILFQLPPAWRVNLPRLAGFLEALPAKLRYTFEFRNPTWNTPEVYQVLRQYKAALCISEIAGMRSPLEVTADFVYVRLHGPGNAYQGSYTRPVLKRWAARIAEWRRRSCDIYFYFDNDQAGFAAKNAMELQRLALSQE